MRLMKASGISTTPHGERVTQAIRRGDDRRRRKKEGGREREGLGLFPARLRAEAAGSFAATVRSIHKQHGSAFVWVTSIATYKSTVIHQQMSGLPEIAFNTS
jgi:hypothetical protein